MPQEKLWTIMPHEEARAKPTEISSALVTNVGQAAGSIISSILQLATGASLDTLRPNISAYLGRNIFLAQMLQSEDLEGVPDTIETVLDNYTQAYTDY
jgi:hypothetical protein